MITIKNLRNEKPSKPYDIRVDRTSILGNPFYLSNEKYRDEVCNQYHQHFINIISNFDRYKKFKIKLDQLKEIHEKYGKLNLFCWCTPKRCHAETIKQYLENELINDKI